MTFRIPTCRSCAYEAMRAIAGPSRLPLLPAFKRNFTAMSESKLDSTAPFFTPPYRPSHSASYSPKGKERPVGSGHGGSEGDVDPEREVTDREWEMRVGKAMLHLQETLPHFFHPDECKAEMFPPEVFSRNMVLKLPVPFPVKISSLAGYSMIHTLTRNGMSALFTDLHATLDRMSFSPSPQAAAAPAAAFFTKRIPAHRHKQIRVLLSIRGTPRLPPNHEAIWHTSSLYTFSPYSGLISAHEVEKIRPLPGEGVGEWLMSRVLGWTSRQAHVGEGALPCPSRAVIVTRRSRLKPPASPRNEL